MGGSYNGGLGTGQVGDQTPGDPNDTVGIFTFGHGNDGFSGVTYTDPTGLYDFNNPDNFEFGVGGGVRELHTQADEESFKVDLRKYFSDEFAMQFGVKWTNVAETQVRFRDVLDPNGDTTLIDAIRADFLANISSISSNNGAAQYVPGVGNTPFFSVADIAFRNDSNNNANQQRFVDNVDNQFSADRNIYAGYVMLDFDQTWNDLPFSGNVGLRIIYDRSRLDGFSETSTEAAAASVESRLMLMAISLADSPMLWRSAITPNGYRALTSSST